MNTITRRSILTGAAAVAAAAVTPARAADAPATTKNMPLIRRDLELTKEECLWTIEHTETAVLGTADKSGVPYAVPITPFMLDGKIYFHGVGQDIGRWNANLKQNPEVSLCYVALHDRNEPKLTTMYLSVIVAGHTRLVTDRNEKRELMRQLIVHHAPSEDSRHDIGVREKKLDLVNVWEITIDRMTGKAKPAAYEKYFGRKMPKRG